MRIDRNRWNRRTLAAALMMIGAEALITPAAFAQTAGTTQAVASDSAAGLLATARELADGGQLMQAKSVMEQLLRSGALDTADNPTRGKAINLIKSIDREIASADPLEMSLQKSEMAIAAGDLSEAQRQARAVSGKSSASDAQRERAAGVLGKVATRRAEIAPAVPGLIEQALADFSSQKYAESKASILTVLRSGVELTPEQASSLERAQLKIVDLEIASGKPFAAAGSADLGMFGQQPGTVRRNRGGGGTADQPPPDAGRPEPLPATIVGDQPPPPADPAPAPAPAPVDSPPMAQPTPPPAPAASAQDDVLTAALKLEARRVISEADQAYDAARYQAAFDKYSLALAQYRAYLDAADIDRVQKRIDESRLRMGSGSGADLAKQTEGAWGLIRERARAQFANEMAQAERALTLGQPDNARTHHATAQLRASEAKSYFNDAEYAAFTKQLDAMRTRIDAEQQRLAVAAVRKQTDEAALKAADLESKRLSERGRKINENIDRIVALQREQKYEEALQIVDQTLFIDANDPTALLLKDLLRGLWVYKVHNQIQSDKNWGHVVQHLENERAITPPQNLMEFPADWPQKTFQRGEMAAYAEPAENRRVLAQINSNKIPLDLTDNRFEDVLKFIAQVTQLSIDPDWESLAAVGVEKDTPVTLKLQNKVTVQAALERVLAKVSKDQYARAGWAVADGGVVVGSEESLRKTKVLVIYNIQDLLFQIPNYRQVPQIDLQNVLQSNQGGGGGQSPFSNANDQPNQDDPAARERRIRQIIDILYANVDFEGWKDNGGETGSMQELNGSLIITQTPRNHREIVGLLSKLREIRNMQINVETKFLLVNQQWFEQIGFDLDIVFNASNNQIQRARAQDPSVLPSDFFNFASAGGNQRGLQRRVTGQGSTTTPATTLTQLSQATIAPNVLSPISTFNNSIDLTSSLSEGDFASGILGQAPALGIAGQFLDDIQVNFLIVATQADKRSVRLTAPRLTFTNGQTANIYVATQQAFVSQLTPVVGDSAVGFNPQTSVLSEGVTMLVEGVISSDRRYVTMNIDSGVSRIDQIRQSPVTAIAGGQLVNSAATQSFIELPQVTVTRVRTTATVPDEGTLLLGGQRLITEVEVETGVPVLSKIPIVNRFFTNRIETKEEQSLLILVKPTILIQTEEEERAHPGVNDQIRSGLGLR